MSTITFAAACLLRAEMQSTSSWVVHTAKRHGFDVDYTGPDGIARQLAESYRRNDTLVKRLALRT